jgi:Tfp pilus assembly PilM family ATPase
MAISQRLKVNFEEAEKLKLECGLESDKGKKKKNQPAVSEAILPILNELVENIKKYISFYKTHQAHEHLKSGNEEIEKIMLCGRGANLKGFSDFLSLALDMPVELGNPWINILPEPLKEVPGLPFKESLGYTTALGLALRGINTENSSA